MIELTILMPCLNEAETLASCIEKAKGFLARTGIRGEVLISDKDGKGLEAVSAGLMGLSTMRRYAAALRDLKQAPNRPCALRRAWPASST